MIKLDSIPFDCGVAWAAAFLAQSLGQETMALEVLKEAGIADVNTLISIGIDEIDLDVLKPILKKEIEGMYKSAIKTNCRFDKLTNNDISTHYRNGTRWFPQSDMMGSFAYWVVAQSPYENPDISEAMSGWNKHLQQIFPNRYMPVEFSYAELRSLISEKTFEAIPEIEKLNHRKNGRDGMCFSSRFDTPREDDDFIDLGALANNVFYMLMRNSITQD